MEPIYENIQPNIGSSFYYSFVTPGCCEPFWHMHPEYELVYIHSGSAERHVGSNVSKYTNGDLLLIGSNIPHSNLGNHDYPDNKEIVIQMSADFVQNRLAQFPEFDKIKKLFIRSHQGISFDNDMKEQVGSLFIDMKNASSIKRFLILIEALQMLATTKKYTLLNANNVSIEIKSNDYARVNKINEFVAQNYKRNIQLKELAELTGLTETSFSRFFKKVTGKNFITFLNEYRIQKACSLLADKNTSISEVMGESGFIEPAHFTRVFKKHTSFSPRDYRKKIREWR